MYCRERNMDWVTSARTRVSISVAVSLNFVDMSYFAFSCVCQQNWRTYLMLWHRKDLIDYFYVLCMNGEDIKFVVCSVGLSKIVCSFFFEAQWLNCVILCGGATWSLNLHVLYKLACEIWSPRPCLDDKKNLPKKYCSTFVCIW
jgi:hypothetical protein